MVTQKFNPLDFFTEFKKKIEAINKYPLSKQNLHINEDALQHVLDDDTDESVPFAVVEMARPHHKDDLLFSCEFYPSAIMLTTGSDYPIDIDYKELKLSSSQLAERLVAILIGLCNGQIASMYTIANNRIQAIELLYKAPKATLYAAFYTLDTFQSKRALRYVDYETDVYKNDLDFKQVDVDIRLLSKFFPRPVNFGGMRGAIANLADPLTLEEWQQLDGKRFDQRWDNYIAKRFGEKKTWKQWAQKYSHFEVMTVSFYSYAFFGYPTRDELVSWVLIAAGTFGLWLSFRRLRKGDFIPQLYMLSAYFISLIAIFGFTEIEEKSFMHWLIFIIMLEPIVEMILMDGGRPVRRIKSRQAK